MNAVKRSFPGLDCHIRIISTRGDRRTQAPLSPLEGTGFFSEEIQDAVLRGEIDVGVHSLKDLPTNQSEGLRVVAVSQREDARDLLYTRNGTSLKNLPNGASIGTCSLRRSAQIRYLRPDVTVQTIRGNVDTRMHKVDEGQYDAAVLAVAGLARLGLLQPVFQIFSFEEMLPAPGQGALAVEIREDNTPAMDYLQSVNHKPTHFATTAERSVLRILGGGCAVPLAAYAEPGGEMLNLQAAVFQPDGTHRIEVKSTGSLNEPESLGNQVAKRLIAKGADEILEEYRT